MRLPALEKVAFVGSLLVFAFFYGIATQAFGWFPSTLAQRAWNQAERSLPLVDRISDPNWTAQRRYQRVGARVHDRERIAPGLTLVSSWEERSEGWKPVVKLLDRDGEIVHRWGISPAEVFPDPSEKYARRKPGAVSASGSYLFPNGDLLINVTSYLGLARIDACGKVLWRLPAGTHHSVARADDGSFWIPAGTYESAPDSLYPGLQPNYRDRLLHVAADGHIVDEIIVLDVLYANGLEHLIPKYVETWTTDDLTHLNDVEPLPEAMADEYPLFEADDLVVSLRDQNLVFVLDPDTYRVKWHATGPFIAQHDPDFIGDGWIGIFDNRRDYTGDGSMLGGSRVVALQPHTDSTKVLFEGTESVSFHTPVMGKWQQLDNGNLLLTQSRAGRVIEVTARGDIVWEWVTSPYSDSKTVEVPEGTRYDLTLADVASWPCSRVRTPEPTEDSDGASE